MTSSNDWKKKLGLEAENEFPDILYKPCKFCGSLDYDMADGDVDDKNVFEPDGCDVCGFKCTQHHLLTFH